MLYSRTKRIAILGLAAAAAVAGFFAVRPAQAAATRTWSGSSPVDANWNVLLNWDNATPVSGDSLVFPSGAARLTNTNNIAGLSVAAMTFSGTNYVIGGNQVTMESGGAGISNTGSTNTISLPLSLAGTTTVNVAAGTTLTVSGAISGAGGIQKTGTGTLVLSGNNTYTGATAVNAGTLRASHANAFGSTAGATTVADGAMIEISDGTALDAEPMTVQGTGVSGAGAIRGVGTASASAVISLAADTTVAATGTTTLSGAISGSGALTKVGSGMLVVTGTNTYTGATVVSAGTHRVGATGGVPDDGVVSLADAAGVNFDVDANETIGSLTGGGSSGGDVELGSATLTISTDTDTTFAGIISGSGGLTKAGSGVLTLTRTNTYTGTTRVDDGTLRLGAAGVISDSSPLALAGADAVFDLNGFNETVGSLSGTAGDVRLGVGTLTVSQTGTGTYDGVMTGAGALVKAGTSALTLAGANSYSGATTVSAGTLRAANATALGSTSSGTTVASGATLDLNGVTVVNEAVNIAGTGVSSAGALTGTGTAELSSPLTLGAAASVGGTGTLTMSAPVAGSFALTKVGSGTVVLGAANSYTGATTVSAGTLQVTDDAGLGTTAGGTTIEAGGTLLFEDVAVGSEAVTFSGSGSLEASGVASLAGTVTLSSAGSVGGSGSLTLAGTVSGSGALTKTGTGTTSLAGANTFTGATTVEAGILLAGHADALGATGAGTTAEDGATLSIDVASPAAEPLTLTGSGSGGAGALEAIGTVELAGGVALADDAAISTTGTLTLSGVVSGSGALEKVDTGTVVLTGTNTYSGGTTVSEGTLRLGNSGVIPDSGTVTLADTLGATLDLDSIDEMIGALAGGGPTGGTVDLRSGVLTVNQSADATFSGSIVGLDGALTKAGTGTLTLAGQSTYTGTTRISAGTLRIGVDDALSSSTTLSLSNVASAVFDLNGFDVSVGNLAGGGANGGTVSLGSGTLTALQASDGTFSGTITGTGGFVKAGSSTLTLGGASTYTGATTVSVGTLGVSDPAALGTTAGATTVAGGATLALDLDGATLAEPLSLAGTIDVTGTAVLSGVVSGSALAKDGTGTLVLTGANTYTGGTTVSDGTLRLGGSGVVPNSGTVTVGSGAVFDVDGFDEVIFGLAGPAGGTVALGTGTLTVNAAASTTFAGTTAGSGSLVKSGASTLTLSGTTGHTGGIRVSAGTLNVGGDASSSALVLDGGTLGGTGTVGAVTSGAGGGVMAPGPGTKRLGAASLTGTAATSLSVRLDGKVAGTSYDQVRVTGSVTLGSALSLSLGYSAIPGTSFTIIDKTSAGAVSGTFAGLAEGATVVVGKHRFTVSYRGGDGNDVVVKVVTPVVTAKAVKTRERTKKAVITVKLSVPAPVKSTVRYATANGTARAGKDYRAKTGTLTFKPGATSAKIVVPVYLDKVKEKAETFLVKLSSPKYLKLKTTKVKVTILDG
jgi:autotransporter-associated beta strand protein